MNRKSIMLYNIPDLDDDDTYNLNSDFCEVLPFLNYESDADNKTNSFTMKGEILDITISAPKGFKLPLVVVEGKLFFTLLSLLQKSNVSTIMFYSLDDLVVKCKPYLKRLNKKCLQHSLDSLSHTKIEISKHNGIPKNFFNMYYKYSMYFIEKLIEEKDSQGRKIYKLTLDEDFEKYNNTVREKM